MSYAMVTGFFFFFWSQRNMRSFPLCWCMRSLWCPISWHWVRVQMGWETHATTDPRWILFCFYSVTVVNMTTIVLILRRDLFAGFIMGHGLSYFCLFVFDGLGFVPRSLHCTSYGRYSNKRPSCHSLGIDCVTSYKWWVQIIQSPSLIPIQSITPRFLLFLRHRPSSRVESFCPWLYLKGISVFPLLIPQHRQSPCCPLQ